LLDRRARERLVRDVAVLEPLTRGLNGRLGKTCTYGQTIDVYDLGRGERLYGITGEGLLGRG
jgi:hypothetical protein